MRRLFNIIMLALGVWAMPGYCESPLLGDSLIKIVGRTEVIVTEPSVRLADIAQIESPRVQDDEGILELRKLVIASSPRAGESVAIEGVKILERLRDNGVNLDRIRYTFPRQVSVTRAFREISIPELERALLSYLEKSDKQMEVRKLMVDKPVKIPADSMGVEVVSMRTTQPGHIGVDYRAISNSEDARFQLRAVADEWRLLPVAVKPLRKGAVVTGADVQLTRVNATASARDAVESIGDIVGHSLTRDIGQGELFRSSALAVPPVINAGSRVTLIYKEGRLEATASGVAMENGVTGQQIRVRNENSKKIVAGRVAEQGLVMVGVN